MAATVILIFGLVYLNVPPLYATADQVRGEGDLFRRY
jgi:hypothetical protein